jgi:uncharacterized membrane protein (DUF2068 family)
MVRPARLVIAASYLTIVGLGLLLVAALFVFSALSYRPQGVDELVPVAAVSVIAAVIVGSIGLLHLLAGIGSWRRRMWGWWLAVLIFAAGLAATLLLTLNAVEHLSERFGTTPDAVVTFGAGAVLFASGVWAMGSTRAWFFQSGSES